jgi:hypothetical protein
MDLGGSYNEAAILTASHHLPGGVRPWALLSRQVSAAPVSLPLPGSRTLRNFLCFNLRVDLSRAGLEPATHWLKASCSTD